MKISLSSTNSVAKIFYLLLTSKKKSLYSAKFSWTTVCILLIIRNELQNYIKVYNWLLQLFWLFGNILKDRFYILATFLRKNKMK